MLRSIILIIFTITITAVGVSADEQLSIENLKKRYETEYKNKTPHQWGEQVTSVYIRLDTKERVIALTFDACGGGKGNGADMKLISYLIREKIPSTLFINSRWIDANISLFRQLASNPLFEIANHGTRHKPASISGRSVYGLTGTGNIGELIEEIELNARKIESITSKRPKLYRSGTAYYDEYAVQISERLNHKVIGYSVLGDAGARYTTAQVKSALLKATSGDIALLHINHPEAGTGDGVIAAIPELKKGGFKFVKVSDYPLKQ